MEVEDTFYMLFGKKSQKVRDGFLWSDRDQQFEKGDLQ